CAAGCVVFRIEINNQPFAGEVLEFDILTVLIRKRKIWELFACLEHSLRSSRGSINSFAVAPHCVGSDVLIQVIFVCLNVTHPKRRIKRCEYAMRCTRDSGTGPESRRRDRRMLDWTA